MEDIQIIKLFQKRSEDAISQISQKYGLLCRKMADNILNNDQDVEESINDAYFALWNSIPPNEPNSICNYLCKTLRNLALKKYHYNTAQKRNSSYDIALDELSESLISNDLIENSLSIETSLSTKELGEHINEFLAKLDKENRTIFVLRYWYAASVNDIATKFGAKPNTISTKLKRTRDKLKNHLISKGVNL